MDAGRDNSSYHGFVYPTMSRSCKKWSDGDVHNALGSHFTKKHDLTSNKMKNQFFLCQTKTQ
jgi:hypothetical protein